MNEIELLQQKEKRFGRALLILSSLVLVFHTGVLLGLVPQEWVWAGKVQEQKTLLILESVSITMNLVLMLVVASKLKLVAAGMNKKLQTVLLWFFVFVFALNTVGNLFAKTKVERTFSILTLIYVILLARFIRTGKDLKATISGED
jgi:hypothetical protein